MRSQNARRSEDGEVIMCVRERESTRHATTFGKFCVFPDQKKKKKGPEIVVS